MWVCVCVEKKKDSVLDLEGMGNLCVCLYVCKEKAYCIDLGGETIGYIMG